jgi:hypothetical protein
MSLTAEAHEPVPEVTANALDSVRREEGLGSFVVLSSSEKRIHPGRDRLGA